MKEKEFLERLSKIIPYTDSIEIPIYYGTDEKNNVIFDRESMTDEFNNILNEIEEILE